MILALKKIKLIKKILTIFLSISLVLVVTTTDVIKY